jgi:FeS assembly SUF system protein
VNLHEQLARRRRLAARRAAGGEGADAGVIGAGDGSFDMNGQHQRDGRPRFDPNELRDRIVDALRQVFDPEIPVNIWELGLIYDIAIDDEGAVAIKMTLTSPHCPVAESLPGEVQRSAGSVAGVRDVEVDVVWDPAWNPEMMSEAAKLELGMF